MKNLALHAFLWQLTILCLYAYAGDAPRPNILIMVADDLGYADIGVNGCTDLKTPYIDSIAQNGVRFTNGYVAGPVCSPSRAGLITGRFQTRFGHEFNHPMADRAPEGLPVSEKTAAQYFREAGYITGHFGKWHLGNSMLPEYNPQARGFTESVWFPGQKKLPPLQFYRHSERGVTQDRYVDEAIAREASEFIRSHNQEPWFLYVAFITPHQPLDVPESVLKEFENIENLDRRKFIAAMSLLDGAVGKMLQCIRETNQEERTLITFISDNGAPPKNGSRNTPLRGFKGSTWEGGLRVPFVMQWKSMLPSNQVFHQPVSTLDLLPTSLSAAKVEVDSRLDGINLLPMLLDSKLANVNRVLYWRYGEQMAIRRGSWKLCAALDTSKSPPSIQQGLYNLEHDPSEQHNQATEYPEKVQELKSLWDRWNQNNVRALWGDNKNE